MPQARLGLTEALGLVVGAMVGSGILILPGLMAGQLPSPWLVVAALVLGGVLSAMGCLVMAELATLYPRAGGQYHYLREGLGPVWGYLFGWGMFWLVLTGILAGIAAAFAGFLGVLVPLPGQATPLVLGSWDTGIVLPPWGAAFAAVALIWSLVAFNLLGTRAAGILGDATAVAKYLGLALLVVLLFAFARHTPQPFMGADGAGPFAGASAGGFAAALAFGLFAFDGWVAVTFVAADVRHPLRNLPIALLAGPLLVAALYVLLTVGYFLVLPAADAAAIGQEGGLIAFEAVQRGLGAGWATFLALLAAVSLAGTANAFVLTAPRIFWSMARDGALFAGMARLSAKGVPVYASVLAAIWASLLVLSGLYASIVYMVVFGQWLFYGLTAIAHLRLRRKDPRPRPFRTPLGPVVPALFLLASSFVVLGMLGQDEQRPYAALAGLLLAAGIPFHFWQRRRQPPRAEAAPQA